MGFATHLGPWMLGTLKNTTGTTAGTVRNMGATIVAQTKTVNFNDGTGVAAFAIPAGALITGLQFVTTTTFDAASTILVKVSGTAICSATTITTGGSYAIATTNSQAVGRLLSVGTTDVLVTYDLSVGAAAAGIGELVIEYIVRDASGSIVPTP
jgi:hypothetical protein